MDTLEPTKHPAISQLKALRGRKLATYLCPKFNTVGNSVISTFLNRILKSAKTSASSAASYRT